MEEIEELARENDKKADLSSVHLQADQEIKSRIKFLILKQN